MRRRVRDERGAFVILWAMLLVALMTMVALAVDLGHDRSTRRNNQSLADFAALAAGQQLAGQNQVTPQTDPYNGCRAALGSIMRNEDAFPKLTDAQLTAACSPFSTLVGRYNSATGTGCRASTAPVTIDVAGVAPFRVLLEYPVPPSDIANSAFTAQVGANDGTDPCERMKVSVSRPSESFFRGVVGASTPTISASAVVRGSIDFGQKGLAALLLLERRGCGSLQNSGQGAVVVQSIGDQPGRIQADSFGDTSNAGGYAYACTNNTNAGGYVIYATALPASAGGGPAIIAQATQSGKPGIIGIKALDPSVNGRAYYASPAGITPQPTAGDVASRLPVDERYNNGKSHDGAITSTRDRLLAAGGNPGVFASMPSGYTLYNSCNAANGTTTIPGTKLWVDCANFNVGNGSTVVFSNATNVVFTGKISVAGTLAVPGASEIAVRGCVTGCNGGNNYSISVSGQLFVNTGNGAADVTTNCLANRNGPGNGGAVTNKTLLAQFGGPFLVTGKATLCQTTVYMGETASPEQSVVSGANPYGCTIDLPCPTTSTSQGYVAVTGGGGNVDWTAPNQLGANDPQTDASNPFEDLAFWTESSLPSQIKGQGTSSAAGVFFTPNALVTFQGQAAQNQPLNAQFISRFLNMSGQGVLNLRPNPADAVLIPVAGSAFLIR